MYTVLIFRHIFCSAGNGRLTYLVPKPKEEKKKRSEPEEAAAAAAAVKEESSEPPSGEGGEESLYDRFGRMLKRS
jgi:hypothetical protein